MRVLKIAILVMTLMIVAGVVAVVGRIMYLASQPPTQAVTTITPAIGNARLALPSGATIRHLGLSGNRIAVHFEAPVGAGIAVMDLATGKVITRIDVVPEAPRNE